MASFYTANNADAYERLMGRWSRSLAAELIAFCGLETGETVLDLGCGTGSLVRMLAARPEPASLVAIDIAPLFVRHAAAHLDDARLHFIVGDACAVPLASGSVDRSLSLLALNFVSAPDKAIAEMVRVTKSRGTVAAAVWDFAGGLVYQRIFWDTAAALDQAADRARARQLSGKLLGPGEMAAAFAASGLTRIAAGSLTIRMEYENFADYWQPIASATGPVGDYVRATEPALLARIEERIRAAYLHGGADGPRSMAGTAWVAKGVR
jgi:SAM-dependent methyltransferase